MFKNFLNRRLPVTASDISVNLINLVLLGDRLNELGERISDLFSELADFCSQTGILKI